MNNEFDDLLKVILYPYAVVHESLPYAKKVHTYHQLASIALLRKNDIQGESPLVGSIEGSLFWWKVATKRGPL